MARPRARGRSCYVDHPDVIHHSARAGLIVGIVSFQEVGKEQLLSVGKRLVTKALCSIGTVVGKATRVGGVVGSWEFLRHQDPQGPGYQWSARAETKRTAKLGMGNPAELVEPTTTMLEEGATAMEEAVSVPEPPK